MGSRALGLRPVYRRAVRHLAVVTDRARWRPSATRASSHHAAVKHGGGGRRHGQGAGARYSTSEGRGRLGAASPCSVFWVEARLPEIEGAFGGHGASPWLPARVGRFPPRAPEINARALQVPGCREFATNQWEGLSSVGRIKQSLTFWPISKLASSPDFAQKVAAMGFVAIEMGPEAQWPAIRAAGLAIPIVGGHGTLTDGLNKPANHDRIEGELRASITKASQNGIPSLIVFSGNRNGLPDDEGIATCAAGIRRVIRQAEDEGVTLCMELLNSKVDHRDYQCDHTAWGVQLCEAVGSPRFKLLYDIYHMQIMEGDLIRNIRDHIRYIGHFHTAGNPGRHNLDETQEIYYPAVMRAIADTGYDGYVGHEFGPVGDPIAALQQAYAACNV